jgi:hypothetical protein
VDVEQAASVADYELFGRMDEEFKEFVEDIKRQNEDRADLQLRNLERHLVNQRRKIVGVLERHRLLGRESMVKPTEGRLNALENRIERRRIEIEKRREVRYSSDEILAALVLIE